MKLWKTTTLIVLWTLSGIVTASEIPERLKAIENIVVIYLENHSFDNLYGFYPGAEGLSKAPREKVLQVDAEGQVYPHLPQVMDTRKNRPSLIKDSRKSSPMSPFPSSAMSRYRNAPGI